MLNRKFGVALLALGVASAVGSLTRAEAPVPTPRRSGPFTSADRLKAHEAYFHKALTESYKSIGLHDPKWDGAAIAFLEATGHARAAGIVPEFYRPDSTPTAPERLALGKRAYDAGCRDPMVVAEYAMALWMIRFDSHSASAEQRQTYLQIREGARDSLVNSKYPAIQVAAIVSQLITESDIGKQAPLNPKVMEKLLEAACEQPHPADRQFVLNTAWNLLNAGNVRRGFVAALALRPNADPWLLKVMQGRLEIDAAWESRGNGWAQQVTADGWKGFHAHLSKARSLLVAAHEIDPSLPEAAAEMIKVAMGDGPALNETVLDWFDRSQEAQVDFGPSYTSATYALSPRWGGSYDQMLQLVSRFLIKPRYDTELPWDYILTLRSIGLDQRRPWAPLQQQEIYDTAVSVAEGYAGHFGSGARGAYYKSVHAAIAVQAAHYEDVRKVAEELKAAHTPFSVAAFSRLDITDPPFRVSEAYAKSGEHAKTLVEIENLIRAKREVEAFKLMDEIWKTLKPDNPEYTYFDGVYLDVKFLSGQWTPLPAVVRSWSSVDRSHLTFPGTRDYILISGEKGQPKSTIWQGFARNFKDSQPFDFEATFTFTEAIGESATAGILFYAPGAHTRMCAYVDAADKKAGFAVGADAQALWDVKINPSMTVLTHVEDGKVTLFVNGKQIGDPYELGPDFKETFNIGVGGIDAAAAKFTNLRVRKILPPVSKPGE